MQAGFEAHLRVGDVTIDRSDAALLRAVDETGSLQAAAASLGRSYSRAHRRITALEAAVGPLVERRRGGPEGGGSTLTDGGRDLLARFARLQAALADTADTEEVVIEGAVRDRTGELAVVETAGGTVRALLHDPADAVQVAIRTDAITLHAPDAAPAAAATSARNRFAGVVTGIDRGDGTARVTVDVGTAVPLVALVTTDSLDRLDLRTGADVVASFKATATRATPA